MNRVEKPSTTNKLRHLTRYFNKDLRDSSLAIWKRFSTRARHQENQVLPQLWQFTYKTKDGIYATKAITFFRFIMWNAPWPNSRIVTGVMQIERKNSQWLTYLLICGFPTVKSARCHPTQSCCQQYLCVEFRSIFRVLDPCDWPKRCVAKSSLWNGCACQYSFIMLHRARALKGNVTFINRSKTF